MGVGVEGGQGRVDVGAILHIENKGIESYADPKNPPLRTGRVSVRTPTASSRAADLVGKVVRAVRELGQEGASLKDITSHLHSQGALPTDDPQIGNLVRHATKRALQRGFLIQSGKTFTLGTAARHRKSGAARPSASKKLLGGGIDDDDDDLGVHLHSPTLDGSNPHLQVSRGRLTGSCACFGGRIRVLQGRVGPAETGDGWLAGWLATC
ncbi:Histone acetyltransferase KAT6B [Portunus trituberculatus]|uniref:Histone acetyltransferase KAT6B n=1 Tax=Portunus trituberculatus TaxID=210409 RepID=A0A5B7K8J7_PORTR|nr:Histone acetyltransferase KAT6B [Portunus trituberculatus]